jgi:nucleotide-binding universal stress UspA family protein
VIKKILVAVAGRGLCEEMLNMLLDIPAIQQASVTVLHVVPQQIVADDMAAKLEEGGKILAEAVKSLNIAPEKVNPRLKQGDAKTIVCEIAEEEDVDLIIMGSRALGRLQAILEGSVSQYVFQLASRPMLLVKDDVYVKKIKRVMVAMDKSKSARQCLDLALFLLREVKGGQLFLVRANPDKGITSEQDDPVLSEAVAEAKKYGVDYRCILQEGKPGEVICNLVEENNIDLLTIGSPDRRPSIAKSLVDLDRLLGNSLSDYVRVYANCPVLISRTSD